MSHTVVTTHAALRRAHFDWSRASSGETRARLEHHLAACKAAYDAAIDAEQAQVRTQTHTQGSLQ